MSKWVIICAVLIIVIFIGLFVYGACKLASEADERIERVFGEGRDGRQK